MTENEKKYGIKDNDIISIQWQMGEPYFIGFCFGNIQKYLKRFTSDSKKANNEKDIKKVFDYISRLETKLDLKDLDGKPIFNRLQNLINKGEYKAASIHSIDIQEFLTIKK